MATQEEFNQFDEQNPHIRREMTAKALGRLRSGTTKMSSRKVWEDVRDDPEIRTNGRVYKMDNSLLPMMARRIMEAEPRLRGFFPTKKRKGEQAAQNNRRLDDDPFNDDDIEAVPIHHEGDPEADRAHEAWVAWQRERQEWPEDQDAESFY